MGVFLPYCSRGENSMTALHMAALGGHTDCCRTLIANGDSPTMIAFY